MPEFRQLSVFLCHASHDKPVVREIFKRLKAEGWINPWFDEENLYPGQDWDWEIEKAVEASDAVIVLLSSKSVTKEGYVQRELRFVLRFADLRPDGTISVIPVRVEDCIIPRRLSMWQYVDYFPHANKDWAYKRLLSSLKVRADKLGIPTINPAEAQARHEAEEKEKKEKDRREKKAAEEHVRIASKAKARKEKKDRNLPWLSYSIGGLIIIALIFIIFKGNSIYYYFFPGTNTGASNELGIGSTMISAKDGMVMVYIPAGEFEMGTEIHDQEKPIHNVYLDAFWIDQTEVTNSMFVKFVGETDYETDAQKAGDSPVHVGPAFDEVRGADWRHPLGPDSNISNIMDHPVVHVSWNDANAYCTWVGRRLPTEAEWEKAASWDEGNQTKYVYPWGNSIDCSLANIRENDELCVGETTAVGSYENGASPYGVYDMAGNVWEWVADWRSETYYQNSPSSNPLGPKSGEHRGLRGGSWYNPDSIIRSSFRYGAYPTYTVNDIGFRCTQDPSP